MCLSAWHPYNNSLDAARLNSHPVHLQAQTSTKFLSCYKFYQAKALLVPQLSGTAAKAASTGFREHWLNHLPQLSISLSTLFQH